MGLFPPRALKTLVCREYEDLRWCFANSSQIFAVLENDCNYFCRVCGGCAHYDWSPVQASTGTLVCQCSAVLLDHWDCKGFADLSMLRINRNNCSENLVLLAVIETQRSTVQVCLCAVEKGVPGTRGWAMELNSLTSTDRQHRFDFPAKIGRYSGM